MATTPQSEPARISVRVAVLLALIAALSTASDPRAQSCGSNAIVCENNLTGNPSGEWDVNGAGDSTLQGFATDISVNKGGTVHFKVSTTASTFTVNIYRLGYYGGMGARKVGTIPTVTGKNQAACLTNSTTFLVDCGNWTESTSWAVPATAVSGIYIAKLIRSDTGGSSHVPFIVRDDASTSDVIFQTSDTTWQAYNQYGGYSLYQGNPQAAYKVSYNRPFSTRGQASGFGTSNWIFYAEYPMIRWLESNGYDVTYFTGVDADRSGALIRNHKLFLSIGHDEYWSGGQRANVEAARAAGVHLAFLSGNELFWKTRWEPSIDGTNTPYRTLVDYKETHANRPIDPLDPPTWTGTWMDPRFSPPADGGNPGNALSGQFFLVNRGSAAINVPSAFSALRFWRNTSVAQLAQGQTATLANQTLGYEWDLDADNGTRPPGVIQLSSTTVAASEVFQDFGNVVSPATVTHNLTLYKHPSNALVFGAGTVQWVWGLDVHHDTNPDTGSPTPDLNIQQATMNVFGDMGVQPQTRQPGLFPATPSTDVAPPTSTITSPSSGASIPAETLLTISGTATDSGGGVVGGVELSLDGGATWHRATGTANWTYTWRPGTLGTFTLQSRAVDDSGNLEQPTTSISVTITPTGCPCTFWTPSATPWAVDASDPNAIEVGMKFQSDLNGQITGLRFYKAANNTGTHTGHLWTSTGTLLGSVTFSGETASGWQQANFGTPVSITAHTIYVASYHTSGHYSTDSFYFGRSGLDQWPLHAPASAAVAGGNGVYVYNTASAFPNQTYQAENYWVDVVLGPVDFVPPTVSITAPANGAALTGNVTVSATAGDNVGIAGVQFKLDGVNLGAEDTIGPYSITWNTASGSNATHTLTAVARDTSGNLTTSAPISVSVFNVDTFPPTVSMTAPANGAIVSGSAIAVAASASDNNGVVGLQFLLDGAALGAELTSPPYTIAWNSLAGTNAGHTLAARARDAAGNSTTSTAVNVTVANGAPVMDVNVSTDTSTNGTTIISPTFSTASANELLLAFVAGDDRNPGNTVSSITGGGLTWQLVRRTNTQRGDSEIWRAFAAAPLTNVSATATLAQGAAASLTVMSFSNVDTSGANGAGAIGATGSGNGAGTPTATVTTTRANSWVFGTGNDWDNATARTLGANQTLVHQYLADVGDTFWVQRTTNPTSASGVNVTINDTAPTGDHYNLTVVEVVPPAIPTFTVSGTVSPAANGTGTTLTLTGGAGGTTTADGSGNFSFSGVVNGTYTVTPSKAGFTFTPPSQSVTVNGANITGVAFTANPIPTYTISGTVGPLASGPGTTLTLTGPSGGTTTADPSGNFSFSGLNNGTYTVTPSKAGITFTPLNQSVTVNNANVTGVNFTSFSISGTVSPLASGPGTTLTLTGPSGGTKTADASGNFSFSGLANGTYTVTPSKAGITFTPTSQSVTVSNANVTGVNFTSFTISGTVGPLASGPGTTLTLTGPSGGTVTADGSGNFAFSGRANGIYTVTPSKTGFTFTPPSQSVQVSSADVTGVTFTAAPIPTYTISGTVSPLASGPGTTLTLTGPSGATTTADASGNFSFSGLANGTYTVTPSKTGITFTPLNQSVTVNNANVTGVNFASFTISGTVSPLASGPGTTLTLTGPSGGTVTADGSGNFAFSGRANGTYTVTPSKTGFAFTPPSQSVTVSGADVTGITFTASPIPTYTISGTVSPLASGPGTTLTLTGPSGGTTTADASGNFSFGGLANGTYTVTPSKAGITFTPLNQSVTVSNADVPGVNFASFTIAGTVGPLANGPGTTLTLTGPSGGTVTADGSGNFAFSGRANGTYTVTPSKTGFTFTPPSQSVLVSGADVTGITFTANPIPTYTISGTVSPLPNGPGTTLTLSGPAAGTTTADASGNFSFSGLLNGTYTVTPSKTGFIFVPTSQSVPVNGANVTGVNFTIQTAPTTLAIDVNVSKDQPSTAVKTVTSPTFSTSAGNELLLAFISGDYASGANTTVTGVTGGGLTWQLVVRGNVQAGNSEIWRAFAASPLTNVSVTATLSQNATSSLTVVTFTGVDASGTNGSGAIGAIAATNGSSGGPTATLTTTRSNSWVFGVGNDYDNAITRTVGTGQTAVHQYLTPTGDTYWVQRRTTTTSASGTSVTINDTAPTSDRYNLAICEILPPASADGTPPTVSMTAPANNATVSGASVAVSASASDNVGVTSVQFSLDGANLGALVTASPFTITWDSTKATNGTHSLTAVAKDAAGNSASATPVSVTVGNVDPTAPTVSMTSPSNGATVTGTAVTVSAAASDNVGVASVQFTLDGSPLGGPVTTSPYAITWNTTAATNGSHTLAARAQDFVGNQTTSASIGVTVSNGASGGSAPTVTSVLPTSGPTTGGTSTTITGTNFVPGGFAADVFIDMNVTNAVGTTLSAAILGNGTIGNYNAPWSTSSPVTGFTVGAHQTDRPGPVTVNGVLYPTNHTSKSLALNHSHNFTTVSLWLNAGSRSATVAGFFTFGPPQSSQAQLFDYLGVFGGRTGGYAMMQLFNGLGADYSLNIESSNGGTHHSADITITPGATYWCALKVNFTSGTANLNVYRVSDWALVGSVVTSMTSGEDASEIRIGNNEVGTAAGATSYFENLVVDYTQAAFPLGPVGAPGPTVTVGGAAATGVTVLGATALTAVTPANTAGTVDVTVTNPDGQSGTLPGGYTYTSPSGLNNTAPGSSPATGTSESTPATIVGEGGVTSGATMSSDASFTLSPSDTMQSGQHAYSMQRKRGRHPDTGPTV